MNTFRVILTIAIYILIPLILAGVGCHWGTTALQPPGGEDFFAAFGGMLGGVIIGVIIATLLAKTIRPRKL